MVYEVHVLYVGYSGTCDEGMVANCTCTLIRGRKNIIVDTMTPWDKERIIAGLARYHLTPSDITLVVCTHGHSDHIGNNNLFLNAKHIVGFSVSYRDMYSLHPFEEGEPYIVDEDVKIVPTPGHTNADVTVLVRTVNLGIVAVVGDLFEKEEDILDPSLWRVTGGSENPKSQEKYRNEMLLLADHIIPGHGAMFAVTPAMRKDADHKMSSVAGSGSRSSAPDRRPHAEREWKNPAEMEDRPNSNLGHRPSVWEGRLGPSNEWDRPRESSGKRPERGPPDRLPSERLPLERVPRREEAPRSWLEREKAERGQWEERRRPLNDHPLSPPPLLDDETLRRIDHKRARNPSDSWDGLHARPDFDPGERGWPERAPAPAADRFREKRPEGPWEDARRYSRTDKVEERLPRDVESVRREERTARVTRNERVPRDRSFGPPETKARDGDVVSNRFGGGKVRVKRAPRSSGPRREVPLKGGVPEDKDGVRAARREDGFRREDREPRRPPEDRIARLKDDRPRRDLRARDDFHDRMARGKHDDIGGRNGSDSRTMRFHT